MRVRKTVNPVTKIVEEIQELVCVLKGRGREETKNERLISAKSMSFLQKKKKKRISVLSERLIFSNLGRVLLTERRSDWHKLIYNNFVCKTGLTTRGRKTES